MRHIRGLELALAGRTDAESETMMGRHNAASLAQYRRQADRIRLADNGSDKVVKLRSRTAETGGVKAPVKQV